MITAKKAGEVTIFCVAEDDPTVQAQCKVTVKQWVEQVKLGWKSKEIMKGDTFQLDAFVLPTDATDQSLKWESDNESIVQVSSKGEVTAVGYGIATITCTATDQNLCRATCTITVYEKMVTVSLNQEVVTLNVGQELQLQAGTTPLLSRTKGVYWTSSDSSAVAVDSNGCITALKPCENVEISCIAKDGTGVKGTCIITVVPPTVIREKGEVLKDTISNVEYKVTKGGSVGATVQFAKGVQCAGTVTIPDSITMDGVTYKVTEVAVNAFKGNNNITKVVMGKNIKKIGDKAFYQCKKLKSVTIGTNVTSIGNKAFYKCKSLKTITIKTSKLTKKKVGKQAFKGIHAKATIKVPKKKLSAYRSWLKARGIGKKVKVKKR